MNIAKQMLEWRKKKMTKEELRTKYLQNLDIVCRCERNDDDISTKYHRARKQCATIFTKLKKQFNNDELLTVLFLGETL